MRIFAAFALIACSATARAADSSLLSPSPSLQQIADRQTAVRHWEFSLIPLVASQALDISSSWGMRELNPVLAQSNGAFGAKSAVVKAGAIGAFVGLQYLLVRKSPRTARIFEKMNWGGVALTTAFAIHNYAIR
jgi:hypothetical protein